MLRKALRWFKPWTKDNWIALASVTIASCAFVLSVCEGRARREHDLLMVKPYLTIDFVYNDKGAGFLMLNDGLGPAMIRSFVVTVDEKPQRNWRMTAQALGLSMHSFFRVPWPNTVWRPDEQERRLFWIDKSPVSDQLKAQEQRVNIKVCYCSIYDECWYKTRTIGAPKRSSCDEVQNQLVSD